MVVFLFIYSVKIRVSKLLLIHIQQLSKHFAIHVEMLRSPRGTLFLEMAVSTMFPSLSLNLLACHLMDNIEYTVGFKSFFLTPRTGNYE